MSRVILCRISYGRQRAVMMYVGMLLAGLCGCAPDFGDIPSGFNDIPVPDPLVDAPCANPNAARVHLPVKGRSGSATGRIWAAITDRNGHVLTASAGIPVASGPFDIGDINAAFDLSTISAGTYDFIVVLGPNAGSVGNLSQKLAMTSPYRVTISKTAGVTPCIDALLGDTLKLTAALDGTQSLQIRKRVPDEAAAPNLSWTVFQDGADQKPDTYWFANLGNGNFFPLRLGDNIYFIFKVHAELTVPPYSAATVLISTTVPGQLGDAIMAPPYETRHEHDAAIISWASTYGIPPAISKAQIYRETNSWNTNAYRYEPLFDYQHVTINTGYPSGTLLTISPYSLYRLAVPASMPKGPLADGTQLTVDDIDFRNIYTLIDENADGYYSAKELYRNNTTQNWAPLPGGAPDFVAQTTLSASYGLKQVMYTTAVNPMDWEGSPSQLTDVGVSLYLGSKHLRDLFDQNDTIPSWTERWRRALYEYNGRGTAASEYASAVLDTLTPLCRPQPGP